MNNITKSLENSNIQNQKSCISSFDTISLNYSLVQNNMHFNDIVKDYNNFDYSEKIKNVFDIKNNSKYKLHIKSYNLSNHIKNRVCGLEKLSLLETRENHSNDITNTSSSYDLIINFNAKCLKENYLNNITKNNYDDVVKHLINSLQEIIKLNDDVFYNSDVRKLDYTKNIKLDNYSIKDTLITLSKILYPNRTLKRIHKDFVNNETLYFHTSKKSRDKLYSKYNDLIELSNDVNYSSFKEYSDLLIAKNSNNILRYEISFNKHKMIKKYFDVKADDFNCIKFNDLLNSNKNIVYDRFNKYFNKKQKDFFTMIDNKANNNKFNSNKDFETYMLGQALYFQYKDNYELLKKDAYSFNEKNRKTKYNYFVKYKNAMSFYLMNREATNIDYKSCFNDFYNKLSDIDKHCI